MPNAAERISYCQFLAIAEAAALHHGGFQAAAAFVTLSRRVAQIEEMQRRIDEWRESAITGSMSMREPLVLLEEIARGFDPTALPAAGFAPGEAEGNG